MHRASVGELHLDRDNTGDGEVVQSRSRTRVLELRFTKQRGEQGEQETRLYYSEPAHEADLLLFLLLVWKRPGPVGVIEQDGHMIQADRRLDHHYGHNAL